MSHSHSHTHAHGSANSRLGVAFGLNVAFTLIELVGAWATNSTAIAADAVHDLGDSLSLGFAWAMERLAGRGPTPAYTYGFKRLSLLGAFVNAAVLLVGGAVVLTESIPRLLDPGQPDAKGMLALAVLGVAVNGAAVLRMRGGKSLNERVVTWHLIEDVLGWVAVLIVSVTMLFVDLPILDPLLSVGITAWVGVNATRNLWSTVKVFLQAVPEEVNPDALRAAALTVPHVLDLRHIHIWSQEGEHHVLSAELVVDCEALAVAEQVADQVRAALREAGVQHSTLELRTSASEDRLDD